MPPAVPPLILDGHALARKRLPALRERAAGVRAARGSAPRLLLLAFAERGGRAPWVEGKVRAGVEAGVEVRPLVLSAGLDAYAARAALERARGDVRPDAIFLQLPFPPAVDPGVLTAAVPPEADVDAMTPERFGAFMAGRSGRPPATVAAILALLVEGEVALDGREGVVVGEAGPFTSMLREALTRLGARMEVMPPGSGELSGRLSSSTLVVTSASRSGALSSGALAPGSVVVDGGYFNPGGLGDVDLSDGVDHLEALAPVPGGVGPMTVSALLEGVIALAEDGVRREG